MKGYRSSQLEESNYVADFICEIVPISIVAILSGVFNWMLLKWCMATKVIIFKALLGIGVALMSMATLLLGFLAFLAIFEFAKDALKLNR